MKCKKKNRYNIQNPVDIKAFDQQIGFYTLTGGAPNGLGGTVSSTGLAYSCMAAVWPLKTGETVKNMRDEVKLTGKIRIWYTTGLDASMEIHHGSRVYEIKGFINPDESNIYLDILYWERV